jgi:adenylate cyclase
MPITIFSMQFICVLVHACRFWMSRTMISRSSNSLLPPHLKYRTLSPSSMYPTPSSPQFDSSHRQGASGVVVYVIGRTLYVANVGHALAVISSHTNAELISKRHDPYDRDEARRIRLAEGWISLKGLIHDEIDTSRALGYYHDFPVVNARPEVHVRQLTELDEFVIIGNHGLWKYISYQTAVDIARSEASDPMIAAQKLRDFAICCGADGNNMIMLICVADLFRSKQLVSD